MHFCIMKIIQYHIILLSMLDNIKLQASHIIIKILEKDKQDNHTSIQVEQESQVKQISEHIKLYEGYLCEKDLLILTLILNDKLKQQITYTQFVAQIKSLQQQLDQKQQNTIQNQKDAHAKIQKRIMSHKTQQREQNMAKKNKVLIRTKRTQPSVQTNPQYFRVNQETCHKLFCSYKQLNLMNQSNINTFADREKHREYLNYHKIIQMFVDGKMHLQVDQKLNLLRVIKKNCFNQNLISQQQFSKIFKFIVHSMGFRQKNFQSSIQFREQVNYQQKKSIKQVGLKKIINKARQRYSKAKTQHSILEPVNTIPMIKNETSNNRKEKLVSIQQSRQRIMPDHIQAKNHDQSYLQRAMERKKVSKITWQSLFKMTQENKHYNIVIPDIVKDLSD